jgi:transcriptional regulator with XRE-family HTH domain
MARRQQTKLERDLLYDRWTVFGSWLKYQRLLRGLTQNRAAKAAGVSRRQWIRYELGAKVQGKRMERIAIVLHVPLDRLLERAGLKPSLKRNAAKAILGRIHDRLSEGKVELAILELLRLNDRIAGRKHAVGPIAGGVTATYFARAVDSLERLPAWLLEVILKIMQARLNGNQDEFVVEKYQRMIRRQCIEVLGKK